MTKYKELMLAPTDEFTWNIKEYCDSYFAGDAEISLETKSLLIGKNC
jgi:hypothetical protein